MFLRLFWGHLVRVIPCGEGWQAGHVNWYDKYRFRVWCLPTGTLPYRSKWSIYCSSKRQDLCSGWERGKSTLKTELMPDWWFGEGCQPQEPHVPFLACAQFPLEAASPHSSSVEHLHLELFSVRPILPYVSLFFFFSPPPHCWLHCPRYTAILTHLVYRQ